MNCFGGRRGHLVENVYLGPMDVRVITMKRHTGNVTVITKPDGRDKDACAERIQSWIEVAAYSLDIAFFDIFHQKIIDALIAKATDGVRCRVVLYRNMVIDGSARKHRRYIDLLVKGGVQIRWAWKSSSSDLTKSRMLIVDATDPQRYYLRFDNDVMCVLGNQRYYQGPTQHVTRDFYNLCVSVSKGHVLKWAANFEGLWEMSDDQ